MQLRIKPRVIKPAVIKKNTRLLVYFLLWLLANTCQAQIRDWSQVPVSQPNNANLNQFFAEVAYPGIAGRYTVNLWQAVSAFARAYPGAAKVKQVSHQAVYVGMPWQPQPMMELLNDQGQLIQPLNVGSDGHINGVLVLDVFGSGPENFGVLATGAMKNPDNPGAPAQGATAETWGGPLWPENSLFPGIAPIMPNHVEINNQNQQRPYDLFFGRPGRVSDNWLPFNVPLPQGYRPQPCQLNTEEEFFGVNPNPTPVRNSINGIFKVNLGPDMGIRWMMVFSNYASLIERLQAQPDNQGHFAEYFGYDLGPTDSPPGVGQSQFGRIFYGQRLIRGSDAREIAWSAALWGGLSDRTGGGRLFVCPNPFGIGGTLNLASDANLSRYLNPLYRHALERDPDAGALPGLKQFLANHGQCHAANLAAAANGLFGSAEFHTKAELSAEQAVNSLYWSILARAPDSSGASASAQQFNQLRSQGHSSRTAMQLLAQSFLNSVEFAQLSRGYCQ